MAFDRRVQIVVVADAAQAEGVLARLAATTETTGVKTEASAKKIGTLSQQLAAMGPAGNVGAKGVQALETRLTGGLGVAAADAGKGLDSLGGKFAGVGGLSMAAGAGIAGAAIGVLAIAEVAKKGVANFIAYADKVEHVQEVTKTSAEDSSRLVGALGLVGVSVDDASVAFGRLGRNVEAGKLDKFGVEVARSSDGTFDFTKTLGNVADAFAHSNDASNRAALGTAAFGRGWQVLLPFLKQGKQGIEELYRAAENSNPLLNQQEIENARAFKIAANELSDSLNKLSINVGGTLTPVLTDASVGLSGISVGLSGIVDKFDSLGGSSKTVTGAIEALASWMSVGTAAVFAYGQANEASATAAEFNRKAILDATLAAEKQAAAAKQAEQDIKDENAAVLNLAQDQLSVAQADLRAQQVTADWNAQQAQAAQQRGKAIADAKTRLRDAEAQAERTALDDARRISDAKVALAKAEVDAKQRVADAAAHVRDVETQAASSILSAKQKIIDAEKRLAQDRAATDNSGRRVADAEQALRRIEEDIGSGKLKGVDATRAYEDAETNLTRARQDQADSAATHAQKILDDQAAVKQAKADEVKTEKQAAKDIQKARADLAKAEQDAAATIAAARRTIADAEVQANRDAAASAQTLKKAHEDLRTAQNRSGASAAELARHVLDVRTALLAQVGAHARLATDLDTMNAKVADGTWNWKTMAAYMRQVGLTDIPTVRAELQKLVPDLFAASDAWNRVFNPGAKIPSNGGYNVPGRAGGGPVRAGQVYHVGEVGPETFVPDTDGTVLSFGQSVTGRQVSAAGVSRSQVEFNLTVNIATGNGVVMMTPESARALAAQLGHELHDFFLRKQSIAPLGLNGRR